MKICSACKEELPLECFNNSLKSSDGKQSYCRTCSSEKYAIWSVNNGPRIVTLEQAVRNKDLKFQRIYEISLEDYDAILKCQGGGCAICGATENQNKRQPLLVDHCHTEDMVRGILCHSCNLMLGLVHDNPKILMNAVDYLLKGNPCLE